MARAAFAWPCSYGTETVYAKYEVSRHPPHSAILKTRFRFCQITVAASRGDLSPAEIAKLVGLGGEECVDVVAKGSISLLLGGPRAHPIVYMFDVVAPHTAEAY